MPENNDFIEQNKEVLLQEMADKINSLAEILGSVLENPIEPESDGSVMRTYWIAAGTQIGSLTTLFNQYYVLLKGAIPEERRVGFGALLDKEHEPKN